MGWDLIIVTTLHPFLSQVAEATSHARESGKASFESTSGLTISQNTFNAKISALSTLSAQLNDSSLPDNYILTVDDVKGLGVSRESWKSDVAQEKIVHKTTPLLKASPVPSSYE